MNIRNFKNYILPGLFLLIAAAGSACHRNAPAGEEIIVSAAVSLRDAFEEISQLHQRRTGTKVHFNYGASGALQKQIESGAPVDVFASAGRRQMEGLSIKGLILADTLRDFARNSLVLIVPADSKTGIAAVADLGGSKVAKLAIGNPKTVPAGQYAEQALTRLGLWQTIGSKLIQAEDVRQVLDYVSRGEVDAGLVYASDAYAVGNRVHQVATIQSDLHEPILYPIAVVKGGAREGASRKLIDTVMSEEGQAILEKYGFQRAK